MIFASICSVLWGLIAVIASMHAWIAWDADWESFGGGYVLRSAQQSSDVCSGADEWIQSMGLGVVNVATSTPVLQVTLCVFACVLIL